VVAGSYEALSPQGKLALISARLAQRKIVDSTGFRSGYSPAFRNMLKK